MAQNRLRRTTITAWLLSAAALGLAVGAGSCGSTTSSGSKTKPSDGGDGGSKAATKTAEFDLFVFGRTLGTIAPCGCTTEPLGGLQYAFGFIQRESQPGARLVVEPGSFLYPDPTGPEWPSDEAEWGQAEQRAMALQGRFSQLGEELVSGIGPNDLVSPQGSAALGKHPMPRVAANLDKPAAGVGGIEPFKLAPLSSDGVKLVVGVTGVVDPAAPGADKLGVLGDPVTAATNTIRQMKSEGAGSVIVLAHGTRAFAERIAREAPGADLVVVGLVENLDRQRLGNPMAKIGDSFIVEPGEMLQTITHLQLRVDASQPIVPKPNAWTVVDSKAARQAELDRVAKQIEEIEAEGDADPAFVKRLEAQRERLAAALKQEPRGAVIATFDQAKVTCKLPPDDQAKAKLTEYNAWVADGNKKRFAGVKAPPAPEGTASYVGTDECDTCHEEAVAQWKSTVHAGAFQTLVDTNQQYDLSCVSCHVTGFREPGGSEVVENEGLRDVQCEVCHGPGSLHAEDPEGDDGAQHIELTVKEEVCITCHTPEHSDTFDYTAYLRDIVGDGHGKELRASLGEGATGAELRAAGLAKAGGACKKM